MNRRLIEVFAEQHGIPLPILEYYFAAPRKWRFDLAWPEVKLALEQQGGIFIKGRHAQGGALLKEHQKLNHAALLGWRVLFFVPRLVESGAAFAFVARVLKGE